MVGIFLGAILLMNSNLLGLLRNSKETASASQALQERVEQMRIANWQQITNSTHVRTNILNTATKSSVGLANIVETMTISPYSGSITNNTPLQVVRNGSTVTVNSSNAGLIDLDMVRVDLKVVWEGSPHRRLRTRMTTALIANGGITK